MSQNFINENELETESKLSLVVRKPQEGKTSICIKYITDDLFSNNIHIVLTMNTLASGMQFFGRMKEQIGPNRIVVFNSVKKTAGDCHHATNVIDVKSLIRNNNIKVIVCCAHNKKIRDIKEQDIFFSDLPVMIDIYQDQERIIEEILWYSDDAVILKPEEVRIAVIERLQTGVKRYG